ncbi:DUF1501 domain-containing protein [Schlesneria paludicola]|uniref:DUF1501 domain-containing protein n=1 Tax=Schlesneria paludicola TaxID=360056 RepID=UPI000299E099|nr:DUF1501 domain-containing protein [Schlesneria paludicola]
MLSMEMNHTMCHRRTFLARASLGLGAASLATLSSAFAANSGAKVNAIAPGLSGLPHFPARAKRVIFLCMAGGPSHLETFDHKPKLAELHGQPMPESVTQGQPIAQLQGQKLLCQAPMFKFSRHGESGQEISEILPQIGSIADDICIVRSLHTDQINHDPAHTVMNTGTSISGRPSMGAWATYGLGSECADLPGFVVLTSTSQDGRSPQPIAARQWHSGFLPSRFQGVAFASHGDPVHYLGNPPGVTRAQQQQLVETVSGLDAYRNRGQVDPEVDTRIAQYEMAFRMQMSVPELRDISQEPQHVLDLYGLKEADGSFAYNCLLARRLAERGVRFIQLYHRDWDHHNDLVRYMGVSARDCDSATAALVRDLKRLGMLDETLIVWGGEFGRTPMAQSNKGNVGRDHHMRAFSMFLCGGGIKPGITHGATDEFGYHATEDIVHVHDLHATMLHLLGIDHKRLTYPYQGRDFRLTDVEGHVVHKILA